MQSFTCSALLGIPLGLPRLRSRDYHPLWFSFPNWLASLGRAITRSHNPIEVNLYGLDCSAFARHYLRNLFDFFSSAYWDVSLQRVYRWQAMNSPDIDHNWPGFPIRKSTDQRVFVAPRGLSQLTTSFIVFWSQGIHLCALSSLITKRSNLITKRTWLFQ